MTMLSEDSAFALIDRLGGEEFSEPDCFILDAALQKGFRYIDRDAEHLTCSNRDLIAFVRMFCPDAFIKE